jgi:hypothetical protein
VPDKRVRSYQCACEVSFSVCIGRLKLSRSRSRTPVNWREATCTRCRLSSKWKVTHWKSVNTRAFFGIYLGRGRPSRSQVFTLELFPGRHFRVGDDPGINDDKFVYENSTHLLSLAKGR